MFRIPRECPLGPPPALILYQRRPCLAPQPSNLHSTTCYQPRNLKKTYLKYRGLHCPFVAMPWISSGNILGWVGSASKLSNPYERSAEISPAGLFDIGRPMGGPDSRRYVGDRPRQRSTRCQLDRRCEMTETTGVVLIATPQTHADASQLNGTCVASCQYASK